MSSPNEPGDTAIPGATGDSGTAERSAAGAHSAPAPGPWLTDPAPRSAESGEAPPWQRAASRTQPPAAQPPAARIDPRPPVPPIPASSAAVVTSSPPAAAPVPQEPRVNRYITGTAAPAVFQTPKTVVAEVDSTAVRTEVARPAAYASELPDLSGPVPRPPQRIAETSDTVAAVSTRAGNRFQVAARSKGGPVRAAMQIRRIDPWRTLKVSLLLSVAMFFVWMIAVAFLYLVLGGMGVWSKLNSNVGDLLTSNSGGGELVSAGSIFGGAFLIGLVNIVLLTAMATLGAFVYNLSTDIVGGVEVTLADRD